MASNENLQGKYIANTFQKLIQIDDGANIDNNASNFADFNLTGNINDDQNTLLDGNGKIIQGLVVDHSQNGNGGIYIKNRTDDGSYMWGMQIENISGNSGLLFWQPFGGNRMFLKNTGTLWLGNNLSITGDNNDTTLYIKKGIRLGLDSSNSIIRSPYNALTLQGSPNGVPDSTINLGKDASGQPGANWSDQLGPHYGQQYGINMFQSGFVEDGGAEMLWQRVGNVVSVAGIKVHNTSNPYSALPIIKGGFGDPTHTKLIGHGTSNVFGAVEIKSEGNSSFRVTRTNGDLVTSGSTRFSISYNIRP